LLFVFHRQLIILYIVIHPCKTIQVLDQLQNKSTFHPTFSFSLFIVHYQVWLLFFPYAIFSVFICICDPWSITHAIIYAAWSMLRAPCSIFMICPHSNRTNQNQIRIYFILFYFFYHRHIEQITTTKIHKKNTPFLLFLFYFRFCFRFALFFGLQLSLEIFFICVVLDCIVEITNEGGKRYNTMNQM
jgi:hypothetical protein